MYEGVYYCLHGCVLGGWGYSCLCVVYCMHGYTLESTIFIRPNWIKIYGEEYHHEEFVMTGFQEDDLHHLERLRILLLILSGTTPLLAVQLYRTNGINSHIAAYQVVATNNKTVILLSSLKNKQLYSIHYYNIGDGHSYITVKYNVPNC